MQAGQTSRRGGIQDFLCPFTTMRITQGSGGNYSHKGTMSNDVAGATPGNRDNYYAPCDVKCINTIYAYGESRWQSLEKVRFANGRIDYATFEIAHDDTINCKVGQVVKQGVQLGTMGTKGNATGVHCHIQISQSNDGSYYKNKYGIYQFNNEYDTDDCYFIDGTNNMSTVGNWKTLADVPAKEVPTTPTTTYVNLPSNIDTWSYYSVDEAPVKANANGQLKPSKFGGLSYKILRYADNGTTVVIPSVQFGEIKIYISGTPATFTNTPTYSQGNY